MKDTPLLTKEQGCEAAIKLLEPLLWRKAYQAWKRLPHSTQFWIEVEDLFQEARVECLKIFPRWDPTRGVKFITFAYVSVDNRLSSLIAFWTCKKRYQGINVEIENVELEQPYREMDLTIDAVIQLIAAEVHQLTKDAALAEFGYE